jgi:asparaginyl-tRNA synthetase
MRLSFKPVRKPVFVHHFLPPSKDFIRGRKDDPKYALGIDLLAPEGYGEIIGGGERAASLEYLENRSKHTACRVNRSNGISTSAASARPARRLWHGHRTLHRLDVRDRHVRETIPFPRMLYRLRPYSFL